MPQCGGILKQPSAMNKIILCTLYTYICVYACAYVVFMSIVYADQPCRDK